jgi:hypothetical protein
MAMVKSFKMLYTFYQKPNMSVDDYKEHMESFISMVKQYGGGTSIIGNIPSLRDKHLKDNGLDISTASPTEIKDPNIAVLEAFKSASCSAAPPTSAMNPSAVTSTTATPKAMMISPRLLRHV